MPLLLALLAALAAAIWLDNAANRGVAFGPRPASAPGPALGVNLYNIQYEPDPAAVGRSFALARDLGARYARVQAPWEDIEIHAKGDFTDRRNLAAVGAVSAWDKYDRLVAAANAADVALIMRLERPPAWARRAALATPELRAGLLLDGNSTGPPDNNADYADFVRALVERYDGDGVADAPGGPRVSLFQLWNEPNLKNEWNWQDPRPEDFVALLRAGAAAARAASPGAQIIFPGLAPTDGLDSRAPMTELEYLDRVYRAGGAADFDIMAAQSYGLGQSPAEHRYVFLRGRGNWSWRQPVDTRNDVSRVVLLREVMERNGDFATPVWVSEFGWNSAPDSIPAERRSTWGQPVSEQLKGAYLAGQIERARREWPWMGVMNVWMLRYGGYAEPDQADPTPYFALVSRDWQPLPSYTILRDFMARPPAAAAPDRPWGWLWDYGPALLLLATVAAGAPALAWLFGALDRGRARLTDAQRRGAGRAGLLPALISPDGLTLATMALGLLVAYSLSPQLPITALGLAIFLPLALWRPDLALAFVPFSVALYFMPKGIFDTRFGLRDAGISLPLHEVVLLLALAGAGLPWAVGWLRARSAFASLRGSSLLPVGLFAVAGLWGLLIAGERGPALRELRWLVVEPLLFYGLLLQQAGRRGAGYWRLILGFWMAGGAMAGLVALLQLAGLNLAPLIGTKVGFSDDTIAVEGVRRASGLYGHPNNLGLALGRIWPLAAALAHVAFWGAPGGLARLRRSWPTALVTLLCLGGLLASFSRGAYLGAAAGGTVLALLLLPRRLLPPRRLLLPLLALAGLAALAALAALALNIERFNLLGTSSGIRVQTWASTLAMLRDHPLGVGLDQFGRLYPQYIDPALAGTNEINTAHPHNLLLDIALRMGPLGLLAFAWLLAGFYRRSLAGPADDAGSYMWAARAGAVAAMTAALVHGLVDSFYFWPDLAFAFWLLLALSLARPARP